MKSLISITAIASVSPLGASLSGAWQAYEKPESFLTLRAIGDQVRWAGSLPLNLKRAIRELDNEQTRYAALDDSVKYAIWAARQAFENAGWEKGMQIGINIGSSRGATGLFERYHAEFIADKRCSVLSSPTTTMGNISSWVAHDLNCKGPDISHSITCSTALHALLNGIAWIRSGMAKKFLVGGSEAALTPFTLAQMSALKIYAGNPGTEDTPFPCRALDLRKKRNSMVLGEGASVACIESGIQANALAIVEGIGFATEPLEHGASLSTDACCLQDAMRMALGGFRPEDVDVIVLHAPGTIKGDAAEVRAIKSVFGTKIPALTNNKWKIGHTFGASGMLSVEMAVLMLLHQRFIPVPYIRQTEPPKSINRVMVNAVGFGGNAVSILLRHR